MSEPEFDPTLADVTGEAAVMRVAVENMTSVVHFWTEVRNAWLRNGWSADAAEAMCRRMMDEANRNQAHSEQLAAMREFIRFHDQG